MSFELPKKTEPSSERIFDKMIKSPPAAEPAQDSWRCFWCAEVFTNTDEAREHFGTQEGEICACKLTKDEKGLVGLLRDAWKRLDEFYSENDAQTKEFYALGAAHSTALRTTEETWYEKGLADGCSRPPAVAPTDATQNEFEAYPKLAGMIENLGWKTQVSIATWGTFLTEINDVLRRLKASAPALPSTWVIDSGEFPDYDGYSIKDSTTGKIVARGMTREHAGVILRAQVGRMPTRLELKDFYSDWTSHESGEDDRFADAILDLIGRTK